jgi:hypothetical protein
VLVFLLILLFLTAFGAFLVGKCLISEKKRQKVQKFGFYALPGFINGSFGFELHESPWIPGDKIYVFPYGVPKYEIKLEFKTPDDELLKMLYFPRVYMAPVIDKAVSPVLVSNIS